MISVAYENREMERLWLIEVHCVSRQHMLNNKTILVISDISISSETICY